MALDRKWINVGAALTIATLTGPVLAFAGPSSSNKPSSPPPVRQQFNSAAEPTPRQKFNNASGASTQSGKPSTTTSNQTGTQTGTKPTAQMPTAQSLMEAFRAAAQDPRKSKIQGGTSQSGSKNLQLHQENAQAASNQYDKPTVEMRKRQEQQRQAQQRQAQQRQAQQRQEQERRQRQV
jgi:hypothetical protein